MINQLDWVRLWDASPHATFFEHPFWMQAWWRHFGHDKELLLLPFYLHDGENARRLAGVAPLCILRENGRRKVMFVGAGLSDSADVLALPGCEAMVAEALERALLECAERWDECDLQPLPGNSPVVTQGDEANGAPPTRSVDAVDPHEVVTFPECVEALQERWSPHFRDRMREAQHRAERFGEVRFECVGEEGFEETLEALLRFRRARWLPDIRGLADPLRAERFFREIAEALQERGALRLFRMCIAERTAAALLGFVHRGCAALYLTGFDASFAKASPGVLVLRYALEEFVREGASECDFLRGSEGYKSRWGAEERRYWAVRLRR